MLRIVSLRVIVIEDSPLFQLALQACLGGIADARLCGMADTVAAGLELAARARPDVVLMDFGLPDGDGITATRTLVAGEPAVAVIMVTAHDDEETRRLALAAGARAFVAKARLGVELGPLLETLMKRGETKGDARECAAEGQGEERDPGR